LEVAEETGASGTAPTKGLQKAAIWSVSVCISAACWSHTAPIALSEAAHAKALMDALISSAVPAATIPSISFSVNKLGGTKDPE
jgi:hypothetical protein